MRRWPKIYFNEKPLLVFWETTKACLLSCKHCRAEAITKPLEDELKEEDARALIEQVKAFGKPYPIMIFTGGDLLMRRDIFELIKYAKDQGIKVSVSPSVTPLLNEETLKKFKEVDSLSVSLDGSKAETHDEIRGVKGTFERTLDIIKKSLDMGLKIQVNSVVMKRNMYEFQEIYKLIKNLGVKVWEVFFLIKTGRAIDKEDLNPYEYEAFCNFLYDLSFSGITIRCIEAPFIRRIAKLRREGKYTFKSELYLNLVSNLSIEGKESTLSLYPILDGDGIIFVAYNGKVFPGGFLPYELGNIKEKSLYEIYRYNTLLKKIRNREFKSYCNICEFKYICGGSRARAFSYFKDPLESDPACILKESSKEGN